MSTDFIKHVLTEEAASWKGLDDKAIEASAVKAVKKALPGMELNPEDPFFVRCEVSRSADRSRNASVRLLGKEVVASVLPPGNIRDADEARSAVRHRMSLMPGYEGYSDVERFEFRIPPCVVPSFVSYRPIAAELALIEVLACIRSSGLLGWVADNYRSVSEYVHSWLVPSFGNLYKSSVELIKNTIQFGRSGIDFVKVPDILEFNVGVLADGTVDGVSCSSDGVVAVNYAAVNYGELERQIRFLPILDNKTRIRNFILTTTEWLGCHDDGESLRTLLNLFLRHESAVNPELMEFFKRVLLVCGSCDKGAGKHIADILVALRSIDYIFTGVRN